MSLPCIHLVYRVYKLCHTHLIRVSYWSQLLRVYLACSLSYKLVELVFGPALSAAYEAFLACILKVLESSWSVIIVTIMVVELDIHVIVLLDLLPNIFREVRGPVGGHSI